VAAGRDAALSINRYIEPCLPSLQKNLSSISLCFKLHSVGFEIPRYSSLEDFVWFGHLDLSPRIEIAGVVKHQFITSSVTVFRESSICKEKSGHSFIFQSNTFSRFQLCIKLRWHLRQEKKSLFEGYVLETQVTHRI
jgi:hypothetical protein